MVGGTRIGQRGYRLSVFGIVAATLMWASALLLCSRRPDPVDWIGLGVGVGLALGGVLAPGAVRAVGEWRARARDQSTIAEQTGPRP